MKLENQFVLFQRAEVMGREDKFDPRSLVRQLQERLLGKEEKEEDQEAIKMRQDLIVAQLRFGQKLSRSDLAFLKKYAPAHYQEALRIEQGRRRYEQEIRSCRSKQEVEAVRERWQQMFMTELRAIDRSRMTVAEKKAARDFANMRHAAREDSHLRFQRSADYQALPDKEEENAIRGRKRGMVEPVREAKDKESLQEKINNALQSRMEKLKNMADGKEAGSKTPSEERPQPRNGTGAGSLIDAYA